MITISRNPQATIASDKFIYTTLFLYADDVNTFIDGMSIQDFSINSLPMEAQDFVLSFYSVENGLKHLLIKSVVDQEYVKAIEESSNLDFHYLCVDSVEVDVVKSISDHIVGKNILFVGMDSGGASEIIDSKNTYLIGTLPRLSIRNVWLWDDDRFLFWDDESPVGLDTEL